MNESLRYLADRIDYFISEARDAREDEDEELEQSEIEALDVIIPLAEQIEERLLEEV